MVSNDFIDFNIICLYSLKMDTDICNQDKLYVNGHKIAILFKYNTVNVKYV